MADDRFPELRYNRFEDLSQSKKFEYAPLIVDVIIEVLEKHGPLPREGLTYFLQREHELYFLGDTVRYAILYGGRDRVVDAMDMGRYDRCYRTVEQAAAKTDPIVPSPSDFPAAYYQMYELLQLARQDPTILQAPPAFLRELGISPFDTGR